MRREVVSLLRTSIVVGRRGVVVAFLVVIPGGNLLPPVFAHAATKHRGQNQTRCFALCSYKSLQIRHPERSVSRTLRDVQSKDPEGLDVTSTSRSFSTDALLGGR